VNEDTNILYDDYEIVKQYKESKIIFQCNAKHKRMYVIIITIVRCSSLLWPWPWPDNLDIRIWPRYSENVPAYENEVFRSNI